MFLFFLFLFPFFHVVIKYSSSAVYMWCFALVTCLSHNVIPIKPHKLNWSGSATAGLTVSVEWGLNVLLCLCRGRWSTGWPVRCMQPVGRDPLPLWVKGWWKETVSPSRGSSAPPNSGQSLSTLRYPIMSEALFTQRLSTNTTTKMLLYSRVGW